MIYFIQDTPVVYIATWPDNHWYVGYADAGNLTDVIERWRVRYVMHEKPPVSRSWSNCIISTIPCETVEEAKELKQQIQNANVDDTLCYNRGRGLTTKEKAIRAQKVVEAREARIAKLAEELAIATAAMNRPPKVGRKRTPVIERRARALGIR